MTCRFKRGHKASPVHGTHWREDCIEFYGEVLIGDKAHWCPEFDFLPIDETCEEFKFCECFKDDLPS